MNPRITMKRAYAAPAADDGYRILVDRLWPRNLSKQQAHISLWLKEVAPSTELRKWFAHDPAKWPEFKRRYLAELKQNEHLLSEIRTLAAKQRVTLVYAAKDEQHNNALVLLEALNL